MNVMWITNVPLPNIAEKIGISNQPLGGWLVGYIEQLKKIDGISLSYAFPNSLRVDGTVDGISFFSFDPSSKDVIDQFVKIIEKCTPDVIHIFGTEFIHSYFAVQACRQLCMMNHTVISIQGLVSVCAKHYYAFLPEQVIRNWTFRDIFKWDNLIQAKKKFEKRGIYEKKTLSFASNVIGRTDWDEACTLQINPNLKYFKCNESLRSSFYNHHWKLEECEKHSIFVSQSSYPIKGFHLMLEAFAIIKKKYPDAKLYTTGSDLLNSHQTFCIRDGSYTKYLKKLIKLYGLSDSVFFLGMLDENQMCERYLKSNIFVSCSSIENSPNSVGEAMLLGVPIICSDVGGVRNIFTDRSDGYIYPADEPYMIAHYVDRLFSDEGKMKTFSQNARIHAKKTHDRTKNIEDLLNIYKVICQDKK